MFYCLPCTCELQRRQPVLGGHQIREAFGFSELCESFRKDSEVHDSRWPVWICHHHSGGRPEKDAWWRGGSFFEVSLFLTSHQEGILVFRIMTFIVVYRVSFCCEVPSSARKMASNGRPGEISLDDRTAQLLVFAVHCGLIPMVSVSGGAVVVVFHNSRASSFTWIRKERVWDCRASPPFVGSREKERPCPPVAPVSDLSSLGFYGMAYLIWCHDCVKFLVKCWTNRPRESVRASCLFFGRMRV